MVVGLLAILKAGGAYLSLAPSYPMEQLQFILEDSAPVALLTRGDTDRLFGGISKSLAIVDLGNSASWKDQPDMNLDREEIGLDPECLAYVIYTSGSTGKPKGSEIPHRSIPGCIFGVEYAHFTACLSELGYVDTRVVGSFADWRAVCFGPATADNRPGYHELCTKGRSQYS
jgi:long-subunit acyl-CoA synthetase (AMP-forming)